MRDIILLLKTLSWFPIPSHLVLYPPPCIPIHSTQATLASLLVLKHWKYVHISELHLFYLVHFSLRYFHNLISYSTQVSAQICPFQRGPLSAPYIKVPPLHVSEPPFTLLEFYSLHHYPKLYHILYHSIAKHIFVYGLHPCLQSGLVCRLHYCVPSSRTEPGT